MKHQEITATNLCCYHCGEDLLVGTDFELDDKKLKRAGLDYHEWARMQIWDNIELCLADLKASAATHSTPPHPLPPELFKLPLTD